MSKVARPGQQKKRRVVARVMDPDSHKRPVKIKRLKKRWGN